MTASAIHGPWNICIIDDDIPVQSMSAVDDTSRIDANVLRLLLESSGSWGDANLHELTRLLLLDPRRWTVSAFVNPNFYINSLDKDVYRPDVVVYDWEYRHTTGNTVEELRSILDHSYAIVHIYSGATHALQIEQALSGPELAPHRDKRLHKLMKDDSDSPAKLLTAAERLLTSDFSFRFGSLLRKAAVDGLDKVLVSLGGYDIPEIMALLADREHKETDIKSLITGKLHDFLTQNMELRELLVTAKLTDSDARMLLHTVALVAEDAITGISIPIPGSQTAALNLQDPAKRLWSLRQYHRPTDDIVRRGDIVQAEGNRVFMVVTADCDLAAFWHKNFGYVNLVPLLDVELKSESQEIGKRILLTHRRTKLTECCCSSLTNADLGGGTFLCPFVDVAGQYKMFIGFPKEIVSVCVQPVGPMDDLKNRSLEYTAWTGHKLLATLSEPFASAAVQHCLAAISGYGCPDYPATVREIIKSNLKEHLLANNPPTSNLGQAPSK